MDIQNPDLKPERLFLVGRDPCWAQKKCRSPQQPPQSCFQRSVSRKLLLAVRLIFIYCGFGKRSCVPSGWATENPQASSEKSPTDLSNRQRAPSNGRAAEPVEGVWYFLDHRQSLCNTKETLRNNWGRGAEPTTSRLERILLLCANSALI